MFDGIMISPFLSNFGDNVLGFPHEKDSTRVLCPCEDSLLDMVISSCF
jgi:hypothetical protein